MVLIRAAAAGHVDHGRRVAEFSLEEIPLDAKLLNRVERRRQAGVPNARIAHFHAVIEIAGRALPLPAHQDAAVGPLRRGCNKARRPGRSRNLRNHAWAERSQLQVIPPVQRQIVDGLPVDHLPQGSALLLNQWSRSCRHRNLLGDSAQPQRHLDRSPLSDR